MQAQPCTCHCTACKSVLSFSIWVHMGWLTCHVSPTSPLLELDMGGAYHSSRYRKGGACMRTSPQSNGIPTVHSCQSVARSGQSANIYTLEYVRGQEATAWWNRSACCLCKISHWRPLSRNINCFRRKQHVWEYCACRASIRAQLHLQCNANLCLSIE